MRLNDGVRWLCMTLALAACAPRSAAVSIVMTEVLATPTVAIVAQEATATATRTPEPTPEGPVRLVVWWPEPLGSLENTAAADERNAQLRAFEEANANVLVEMRLKRVGGVGGLMETLRTASVVAPGALPDVAIIRRESLLTAVQVGLVQPLDNLVSEATLESFYRAALQLGVVDERLYGLPYALDALHMAYDPEQVDAVARFDELLASDSPFMFPAGSSDSLSDVFLVQYLAAGGTLTNGQLETIDADALRSTLQFYQEALDARMVSANVLEYNTPSDYQTDFMEGKIRSGVVTSSMYLDMQAAGLALEAGPIPTQSGQPATLVNGWLWVVVTPDVERQALAVRLLNWTLNVERQARYAELIHMLPSQDEAMRLWEDADYAEFAGGLLTNAVLPPRNAGTSEALMAMQNALAAVLTGERTAEAATQEVMERVSE